MFKSLFLFKQEDSAIRYTLKAYLLCMTVNLSISALLTILIENRNLPKFDHTIIGLAGSIILGPVVETFMLWGLIKLLDYAKLDIVLKSVVGGLIFGGLHSLSYATWGLTTFFSFIVMTASFLVWENQSKKIAFSVCLGIHILINASALGIVVFSDWFYY